MYILNIYIYIYIYTQDGYKMNRFESHLKHSQFVHIYT